MKQQNKPATVVPWLQVLACVQGVAIVVLAWLVTRGADLEPSLPAVPPAGAKVDTPIDPAEPAPPPSAPAVTSGQRGAPATSQPSSPAPPRPEGTVVYGQIVDQTGAPVRDANASFTRAGETQRFANVSSQNEPAFAIAGVMPGQLEINARATGFRELRDTIEIPADTPRLHHDIVLQSAWNLMVKMVTPEGKPLHETLQELRKERPRLFRLEVGALATSWQPDGDFPPTDLREADYGVGRWRAATGFGAFGPKISKEFAGVLELAERQPLWISAMLRHRVLASTAVEAGQEQVVLTVSLDQVLATLGSVRLRVVDGATGAPVTDARVGISDAQSGGGESTVDAQGQVEVGDLSPGRLRLGITAKDRQGPPAELLLAPGQRLDLGDVPVMAHRMIEGRCENLAGKGDRMSVMATPLEAQSNPLWKRTSARAQVAEDGTFKLWLPEGRYLVRATGAGGGLFDLDTRTLGQQPLVLRLVQEASIRLDVHTGGQMLELTVIAPNGRPIFQRWLKDGWKFPLSCLPGDYRVELKDRHGAVSVRQLHVGPEGADLRVP